MRYRLNKFKNILISLKKGEEFCPKCDGKGRIKTNRFNQEGKYLKCSKCNGDGKIDWVEKAVGK